MEERRTLIRLFPLLAVRLLWSHHVAVVADAVWWLAVGGALCSARIAESRLRMMPGSANSAGPRFLMKGLRRMLTTSRAGKRGIPSPRRHRRRRMWGASRGFRPAMAQGAAPRGKGISPPGCGRCGGMRGSRYRGSRVRRPSHHRSGLAVRLARRQADSRPTGRRSSNPTGRRDPPRKTPPPNKCR